MGLAPFRLVSLFFQALGLEDSHIPAFWLLLHFLFGLYTRYPNPPKRYKPQKKLHSKVQGVTSHQQKWGPALV